MKKIIAILIFMPFLTGCASILYRTSTDPKPIQPGIYPSVRADVQNLNIKDYDPLLRGAEPLVFTLSLVDIPLALALDTIILPFDVFQGISNMRKLKILLNKYFPKYKITKNTNADITKEAYFYLVLPSGEAVDIRHDWHHLDGSEYSIFPQLDNILNNHSVSIQTANEATEVVQLIEALMFSRVITGYWKYQVNRRDNFWIIIITDRKEGKTRLGWIWELEIDSNNLLRKIRSKW